MFHIHLLFLLLTLFSFSQSSTILGLPYQAHSFNDLNSWYQLLNKNVNIFKVDMVIITEESCLSYSTWNYSNECYVYNNISYCCIGLRGDCSNAPSLDQSFNTSDDLLKYMQSNNVFKDRNREIMIALDLDHMVNWDRWNDKVRFLFENFFIKLNSIISTLNINILLDSFANDWFVSADIACQTACSDEQKSISDLPFIAIGQPPFLNDPKSRYQVLNVPVSSIPDLCKSSFSNISLNYYPYFFWEPSKQSEMLNAMSSFLSCPTIPSSHSVIDSVRLTSNQEPDMVQVYTSSITKSGNNSLYMDSSVEYYKIVLVPSLNPEINAFLIVTYNRNGIQWLRVEEVYNNSNSFLYEIDIKMDIAKSLSFSLQNNGSNANILVCDITKYCTFWSIDVVFGNVNYISSFYVFPSNEFLNDANLICSSDGICNILSLSTSNSSKCQLILDLYEISAFQSKLIPSITSCLQNFFPVIDSSITSVLCNDITIGLITYSYIGANVPQINAIYFEITGEHSIKIEDGTSPEYPIPSRFAFGSSTHLSILQKSDYFAVFEVHTNGLCQFGFTINNGDFAHCLIATDSGLAALHSVPGLLNYNYGRLENFRQTINSRGFATSCSELIYHGKFDAGFTPVAGLYSSNNTIQLIEIHNSSPLLISESPMLGGICGAPVAQNGTVMDSFNLPLLD